MLKLLLFAPAEQLLLGPTQAMSLISVLENIDIAGNIVKDLPSNAAAPKEWAAIMLWHRTEDAPEPVKFVAQVKLIHPDGESHLGGEADFEVSNSYINYRSSIQFPVFPIGQAGIHRLQLFRKRADTAEFEMEAEFPINITHSDETRHGNQEPASQE